MDKPLLALDNLSCERDGRILFAELSASVMAGDIVQITGANGAGKTSLLRILTTLADYSAGQIRWKNMPIPRHRFEYLSSMFYLAHQPAIKLNLTPYENIRFFLGLHGQKNGGLSISDVLQQLNLVQQAHTLCQYLSAGQQRRVALAKLLLSDAQLWILDEPFTAIDRQGTETLERLMNKQAERGGAVILTTHQSLRICHVKSIDLQDYQPAVANG